MSIIVTGATGQLGRLIVESLLRRGADPAEITATGRAVEKLEDLSAQGVATARFDFDAPDSAVLSAGDTLMLVSGSEVGQRSRQHAAVIDAARDAGMDRIIYTSLLRADRSALALGPEHRDTEQALADSGVPYTLLRNGWYVENYRGSFDQAAATGSFSGSAGDGRVSPATRADYAEAAAAVLLSQGHEGQTYELAGSQDTTMAGFARLFAEALGRDVEYKNLDPAAHEQALRDAGLDDGTIEFVVTLDAHVAAGELYSDSTDLEQLIGRPTTPLAEVVQEWAADQS
ncbi:NAD(P)H-binding protein [Citricoccus sp. GCM10030269]|uniref:NAD(P)H-binding protein n=1 Tax=Citricoccus sp. GCM10030269 TaxID=3273388 RepID=UPI003612EDD1